jgi:hypothetical protein
MVSHVVVTNTRIFISDELQITINCRFVACVCVPLLSNLARVRLLILAWAWRERIIFGPTFAVRSKSMHFLFVLNTNLVLFGLIAERNSVLIRQVVTWTRSSLNWIK